MGTDPIFLIRTPFSNEKNGVCPHLLFISSSVFLARHRAALPLRRARRARSADPRAPAPRRARPRPGSGAAGRRRRDRRRDLLEAGRQIRGGQVVLGRVIVVERPLADDGLGGDGVDADRADALLVEQLVGGGEDARGVRRWLMHRSVYSTLDSIVRAAGS